MNIIDIILIVLVVIPGIWTGIRKGFIYQVVTLISIFLGIWLAKQFWETLATWLGKMVTADPTVMRIISFILILIIVFILLNICGRLLLKLIKIIIGGTPDKILGIVLGLFKYALFGGLLVLAFDAVNNSFHFVPKEDLNASGMYTFLLDFIHRIFPFFQNLITKGNA